MKFKNRKGLSIGDMSGMAIMFALIAIIISVGASILTQVQSGQTSNTVAYNASTSGLSGVTTMSEWLPTVAVIIAAAVVIGIIVQYFR